MNVVDEELHCWKSRWLQIPADKHPQTLRKLCCHQTLTNIYTLLKLFATLPLSLCSCERSASSIRRLNNYLRASQTQERLSALIISYNEVDVKRETSM